MDPGSRSARRGGFKSASGHCPPLSQLRWLVGGTVLALLMVVPHTRQALLLQTPTGAYLPIILFALFALAPVTVAGLHRAGLGRWLPTAAMGPARLARESAVWAGLFALLLVETLIDPLWTRWLGWDFSSIMPVVEDAWVARIQDALRPGPMGAILDWTFSYVYAYGYLLLFGGLMATALFRGDRQLSRTLLETYAVVWGVGLASYLFVPVNEPWAVSAEIENVLHEVVPPSQTNPLVAAHLNNEFPSLHAAVCVAAGAVLWRLRRWRTLAWAGPVVVGIPMAIVYLGIHWISDSVAGVALGLLAARFGPGLPLWGEERILPGVAPQQAKGSGPKTEIDLPSSPPPSPGTGRRE